MNKRYAFIFPGQGAQYPGMGKDFYDQFPTARETFAEADELLSQHFSRLIFEGPGPELTLTRNSQLAIYIVSVAIYRTVAGQLPFLIPTVCAGLSLGEYTALTVAGKVSFRDCLQLVKARAEFMNDACENIEGTMQVVLGLEAQVVEEVIGSLQPAHDVWVANLNCPGQVVIAGSRAGVAKGVEVLLSKGAKRALPLDVSGAFHSGLMKEARERLEPYIAQVMLSDTPVRFVMNVPGDFVSDREVMRSHLTAQVTSPVRWEKGIRAMKAEVDCFIEMGCGKTLAGMNKRIGVEVPTYSLETVADLETFEKNQEQLCIC
jgi:[acyl-carrier-protein] S-malonyltransferase